MIPHVGTYNDLKEAGGERERERERENINAQKRNHVEGK